MKPHLMRGKRFYDGAWMWTCFANGVRAWADTREEAYEMWTRAYWKKYAFNRGN